MSKRSFKSFSNNILAFNCSQLWIFTIFFCQILISKVFGSSFTNNEIFVILHFVKTIFSLRKNIAICLTIHSFSSQSSSDQKNIFSFIVSERIWEFHQLNFYSNILLRSCSFSYASIMISAWLVIKSRENCIFLSIDDFSCFFQGFKLPSNE